MAGEATVRVMPDETKYVDSPNRTHLELKKKLEMEGWT